MKIIHPIDSFIYELFPKANKADESSLIDAIESFYTYGPYKPTITKENGFIVVEIDTPTIAGQKFDFDKVISLCEKGKYDQAKPILKSLISKNPTNSEYHRILGQVLSDQGQHEEAIDSLIDALKWDPKNGWALIMMGNIFARHHNDVDTAQKYYQLVLERDPENALAINNVGSTLMQMGKTAEGVELLEKAYSINDKYPNTAYGLALGYEELDQPQLAFEFAVTCMKLSAINTPIGKSAFSLALQLANKLITEKAGMKVYNEFCAYLETRSGKSIHTEVDDSIETAAKLEIAENYNRDYHLIKYKSSYPAYEHLMMHELVHLLFVCEAREEKANMLYVSSGENNRQFIIDHKKDIERLSKEYSEDGITKYMQGLFSGINRQLFNTPIDLFIEDYLFENYRELRPYQFVSLQRIIAEGLQAITDKRAEKLSPKGIQKASRIMNMLNAMQLRDLYGIDWVSKFNASTPEAKEAQRLWEEFSEYRRDRNPAEEYELIQNWGKDFGLDHYFQLRDEIDYRSAPKTPEDLIETLEEDPFGNSIDQNFKKRETETFLKNQERIGTNMAVVMFMVDALQFFSNKQTSQIRDIAMEIAMVGTQGINPAAGNSYKLHNIPGKEFSGYHLLAYYYVSWALAIPEMLSQLQLPFDNEYQLAKTMHNPGIS